MTAGFSMTTSSWSEISESEVLPSYSVLIKVKVSCVANVNSSVEGKLSYVIKVGSLLFLDISKYIEEAKKMRLIMSDVHIECNWS